MNVLVLYCTATSYIVRTPNGGGGGGGGGGEGWMWAEEQYMYKTTYINIDSPHSCHDKIHFHEYRKSGDSDRTMYGGQSVQTTSTTCEYIPLF